MATLLVVATDGETGGLVTALDDVVGARAVEIRPPPRWRTRCRTVNKGQPAQRGPRRRVERVLLLVERTGDDARRRPGDRPRSSTPGLPRRARLSLAGSIDRCEPQGRARRGEGLVAALAGIGGVAGAHEHRVQPAWARRTPMATSRWGRRRRRRANPALAIRRQGGRRTPNRFGHRRRQRDRGCRVSPRPGEDSAIGLPLVGESAGRPCEGEGRRHVGLPNAAGTAFRRAGRAHDAASRGHEPATRTTPRYHRCGPHRA